MRSQGQYGALTCVNSCTWLLRFTDRPQGLYMLKSRSIPKILYSNAMRMYFNVLKIIFDTAQGKGNWVGLEWKPNSLSRGRFRHASLLGTSQYFVWFNFKSFEGLDPSGKAWSFVVSKHSLSHFRWRFTNLFFEANKIIILIF